MKIHYLEIVSHDVKAVCKIYEAILSVNFSAEDALLGGARTCHLYIFYNRTLSHAVITHIVLFCI